MKINLVRNFPNEDTSRTTRNNMTVVLVTLPVGLQYTINH